MADVPDWTMHTPFSDPGRHAHLLRDLPGDVETLSRAARNIIVHYRAQLPEFTDSRLPEVNSRWMHRILARDQAQFGTPLLCERPLSDRVAGSCRDHSLFLTSALREHGVPARTLVGFATYLVPGWAIDHVITEYHDGDRWVRTDPELATGQVEFDPPDMGAGPDSQLHTAAQAWLAHRSGALDLSRHAVYPGAEGDLAGADLVRRYVPMQLAHRYGDEMLLWDAWGATAPGGEPLEDSEVDTLAGMLVAADGPDAVTALAAEHELYAMYLGDERLHPGTTVWQYSPLDDRSVQVDISRVQR